MTKEEVQHVLENKEAYADLMSTNIDLSDKAQCYWLLEGNHRHLSLTFSEEEKTFKKLPAAKRAALAPPTVSTFVIARYSTANYRFLLSTFLRRMFIFLKFS